jgi:hypothetical protein
MIFLRMKKLKQALISIPIVGHLAKSVKNLISENSHSSLLDRQIRQKLAL